MRIVVLVVGLALVGSAGSGATYGQVTSDSTYTVQSGDTLYSIARTVGVSVRTLMTWNDLDSTTIEVGQILRVRPPRETRKDEGGAAGEGAEPAPEPTSRANSAKGNGEADSGRVAPENPPPYGRHTTKTGDTFVSLALRLGTTANELFGLNDRTTAPLSPGRTVRLPRRFGPPTHVVQPGETLYSIAGAYGVSVRSLQAENDLDPNAIETGRRLRIPGRAAADLPPPGQWAAPDSTGRVAVYPDAFAGRLTASGTVYEPDDFVVSHPSLPFDSVVLLSTQDPTRHTFARVIDRGPVEEGVLLDVSDAVAQTLGLDADAASSVALRVAWVANGAE